MAEIRGCLPRFLTHHECLWIYKAEGIDDDFAFDGLDGIDDDGDGAGGELFEGLLGVDVDGGEPAAEARMGVVPAYYCFRSISYLSGIDVFEWGNGYVYRPVCRSISIILVWNTGSTASTLTPVPL